MLGATLCAKDKTAKKKKKKVPRPRDFAYSLFHVCLQCVNFTNLEEETRV